MRSLLFIFLLVCLPFQSTWAMASSYCKHETGKTANHLGHHSHQHRSVDSKFPDGSSPGVKHQDCEACHAQLTDLLISELSQHAGMQLFFVSSSSPPDPQSVLHAGPEKPNWYAVG